jgi:hypothetical protein
MLVLNFLLGLLLDLFLVLSILIVLVIVIILETGEKIAFQGSVLSRLRVRGKGALRVALLGEKFDFLRLLQLCVNDTGSLLLNDWAVII